MLARHHVLQHARLLGSYLCLCCTGTICSCPTGLKHTLTVSVSAYLLLTSDAVARPRQTPIQVETLPEQGFYRRLPL